jgi:hypothetical protein
LRAVLIVFGSNRINERSPNVIAGFSAPGELRHCDQIELRMR